MSGYGGREAPGARSSPGQPCASACSDSHPPFRLARPSPSPQTAALQPVPRTREEALPCTVAQGPQAAR
eukprot:364982-Chlamydomonas_euryale.AAC.3